MIARARRKLQWLQWLLAGSFKLRLITARIREPMLSFLQALASGVFSVAVLLGGTRLFPEPKEYVAPDVPQQVLTTFQQRAHMTLPTNTVPLGARIYRGQDKFIELKIRLSKSDLDALLRQSPLRDKPLSSVRRYSRNIAGLSWWRPEGAKRFLSGEASLPNAEILRLLVDLDQEQFVIVYFEWSES
jgi:hypothetical protein